MIRYRVEHETVYEYAEPVAVSHNELRVVPRRLAHQQLLECAIAIEPRPETAVARCDYFGNEVRFVEVGAPHGRLSITATSRVECSAPPAPRPDLSPPWEEVATAARSVGSAASLETLELTLPSPFAPTSPALADYARASFPPGRALVDAFTDLCSRIHRDFAYDAEATSLATPIAEVLRDRRGVCQDFAHVAIGCLRSLGLPARYVSGYVRTRRADAPPDERALLGADASHAWVSAFCPANGWVDYDPTNDCSAADRHVTLGWGRDYEDVSPVRGITVGGGVQQMSVRVELVPEER